MALDVQVALAYAFRSKGRRIRESDLVNFFSTEKGWLSPDNARKLIKMAESRGLIRRTRGLIEPAFDVSSVSVPLDFYLSNEMLEDEEPLDRALSIALAKGLSSEDIRGEIERVRSENPLLDDEAAAILVLKKLGLDPTPVAELKLRKLGISL